MFKCVLAILIVLAVVAVGGLFRLPALSFRAVRALIRHDPEAVRLTAV